MFERQNRFLIKLLLHGQRPKMNRVLEIDPAEKIAELRQVSEMPPNILPHWLRADGKRPSGHLLTCLCEYSDPGA